jgi:hypothetical protein
MSFKSFSTAQDTPDKSDDKPKVAPTAAQPANQPSRPSADVPPAVKP